nr:NTP transferase domain-containing protein [Lunatimonas sp.]
MIGGKSSRMGTDKSLLCYQGKTPQREHLLNLLKPLCLDVYLSCNQTQTTQIRDPGKAITDHYPDCGPMGAILSAIAHRADCAWLVVACDLPFLSIALLKYLVAGRDPKKQATAFREKNSGCPEPLCTIYEPSSYRRLQNEFNQGNFSPAKALVSMEVAWLELPDGGLLTNVNNPQEHAEAVAKIGRHLK